MVGYRNELNAINTLGIRAITIRSSIKALVSKKNSFELEFNGVAVIQALRLSWVEIKRQFIFARNYAFQEVSGLAVLYIFFVGLFWSWNSHGSQGSSVHSSSDQLLLSYLLWTYAVSAISLLAFDITEEAQTGTLEQMALTPRDLLPWLVRCLGNFVLQTCRAAILYCFIFVTTRVRLPDLSLLIVVAATITILGLYGMGLVIGAVTVVCKKTTHFVNIVHFFLFFFTGIAIPLELLPKGLSTVASIIPLTHASSLLRQDNTFLHMPSYGWEHSLLLCLTSLMWLTAGLVAFQLSFRLSRINGLFNKF